MASSRRSIREWLRNVHPDLEVYVASFEELGYNPEFLMDTDSSDLEQDLKNVVKRVHLRAILKEHGKQQVQKQPEPVATAVPAAPQAIQESKRCVNPAVGHHLIPCAKDVAAFQPDMRSIRSGQVVPIPIWCLRSIQGKVHSQMTFTSGRHKDASVYELIHDMLSGRQRPEEVEPLQVVADERGLHIVRGHRRGLALCALQGMWRNRTVWAPCRLYGAKDPEVATQFAQKDTLVDGFGVQLHGKCPEAWHLGKPLFRTSEEWCDSADRPEGSCQSQQIRQERCNRSGRSDPVGATQQSSRRVTVQLASALGSQAVEHDQRELNRQLSPTANVSFRHTSEVVDASFLEDPFGRDPTDPKFGCHEGSLGPHTDISRDASASRQCENLRVAGDMWTQLKCTPEVVTSMLVYVHSGDNLLCGEVLEVSEALVKLRYLVWPQQEDQWISMDRLQIPDYTSVQPGMEVRARWGNRTFSCRVLEVSRSKDRLRAPVKVSCKRFSGTDDVEKWIGIDRLQREDVKFFPVERVADGSPKTQEEIAVSEGHERQDQWKPHLRPDVTTRPQSDSKQATPVISLPCTVEREPGLSVNAAEASCSSNRKAASSVSRGVELKIGMLVCVSGNGPKIKFAEVLEISPSQVVKVRYRRVQAGQGQIAWLPTEYLKVPGMSSFKEGMQVTVEDAETGKLFQCKILEVSDAEGRTQAPLHVHYNGYVSHHDEWVGADRVRSKLVVLHDSRLPDDMETQTQPASTVKGQPVEQTSQMATNPARASPANRETITRSAAPHLDDEESKLAHRAHAIYVCCFWLAGKCRYQRHHFAGKNLHLHRNIPGLQCEFGAWCWYKHSTRNVPSTVATKLGEELPESRVPHDVVSQPDAGRDVQMLKVTGCPELKLGMMVCVQKQGSRMRGEVMDICQDYEHAKTPVKVRYCADQAGQCRIEWFSLDCLKVPDFSNIKPGMQASARSHFCTVVRVSEDAERTRFPVCVHYSGRGSEQDEWVGVDIFDSPNLVLREPILPTAGKDPGSSNSDVVAVPDTLPLEALPWHEPDFEAIAFDNALLATEEALNSQKKASEWQPKLEETLVRLETEALHDVLEKHNWSGQQFAHPPQLDRLLEDLSGISGPCDEEGDSHSDSDWEPSIPPSNQPESSCAAAPNDWEERMARQPTTLGSLSQLPGLVLFGTFQCISGRENWNCSGEVLVHRGPPLLHGCKVRIWGVKPRGSTWDFDQCYVRILDAHVSGSKQEPPDGSSLDVERMHLFGRIVHAMEFGVPRQKLFVCSKPKVVHNLKCVKFKPINGKLPVIQVPWNTALALPSSHDLHLVEVLDWSGDKCPRGQYVEALQMGSRHSDMSILEAVQISLNLCDWPRGDPRRELKVADFSRPPRRHGVTESRLTVGIQHPGLPTDMVMSCNENGFHVHVLDVNAYLDVPGMDVVEHLLRRRSVGVWFLDHLDNPLDAHLSLFPPNLQDQLTFKADAERPAMTFTIQASEAGLRISSVSETTVRCDRILSSHEAGGMILSQDGGEVGTMLRRINSHVVQFRKETLASGTGSIMEQWLVALSIPGPLLATEQLLQGCILMVDQYVGGALAQTSWRQVLKESSDSGDLVRYAYGRADSTMRKVFERLLRVDPSDRKKDFDITDAMRTIGEMLQQPGLSNLQKHACRYAFLRRLHSALPSTFYEVAASSETRTSRDEWWHPKPRFHVTSPLRRYIDILGMRALKSQLGWTASNPHMLLSRKDLEEAIARTNCRMAAESFGMHIFRTISRMRELSGSGQQILDAVIGAVGPKYINILIPSERTHTLDLKVPVSSLCSSTCVSEYDATSQSIKLTMQNGRDPVETLRIHSWHAQRMTCVICRNYAQPIPHHASPNSIVVWEIKFHGEKDFVFSTGLKMFPESFSSWPDLTDWPLLDRKVETYSQVWSRIKLCQVHAAAVASDGYSPTTTVNDMKWFRAGDALRVECQVDVRLSDFRWVQEGDLAVLSLEQANRSASFPGSIRRIRVKKGTEPVEGRKSFILEVELSKIAELAWQVHDMNMSCDSTWRLQAISIPPNEKKGIQLLQDMQRSTLLQGMHLTIPRSSKQMKREMEMRPLVTIDEVKHAMQTVCSAKLNEKQTLAVQRGLQRPFSMVQGPPGTGKTSFLVQCVAALLSASRLRKRGEGRILVCAPSNHAADHILDRLLNSGVPPHYLTRIYSRFIERYHGSLYKGGTAKSERSFWIQPHLEGHALHWKVSESPKVKTLPSGSQEVFDRGYEEAEVQVLRNSRIVITTCTTAYLHTALVQGEAPHVIRPVSFDSIVIDEAAQASEPDIVLPATSARCRVIVVGDHKQLGPVVPEGNLCAPYVSALETPFLERMYQNPRRLSASTMLNMQYRMHPSIRSFPSSQFYESMLEDQVSITHRPQLNCIWPKKKEHRCFINCHTPQSLGLSPELTQTCHSALAESKVSLKNVGEARSVVAACAALLRRNCEPRDIAVITPYKAQQDEIRCRLERDRDIGSKSASILVGTVHALQGCEREYIIVSFVRSTSQDEDVVTSIAKTLGDSGALQEMYGESLGILKNYRVLNVAITRAKYGFICVGNADVLSKGSKDFHAFIHSLRSCKCIVSQDQFLQSIRSSRASKQLLN